MDTAADAITVIDDQLRDAGVQFIAAKKLRYLDEGQRQIYTRHPESAQISDSKIIVSAPPVIDETTDPISITRDFQMALVHYVCWKCLSENTDDEQNQALAAKHESDYEKAMAA